MQDAFQGIAVLEVETMTPGKFAGFPLREWGVRSLRIERAAARPDRISDQDLPLNRGMRPLALGLWAAEIATLRKLAVI